MYFRMNAVVGRDMMICEAQKREDSGAKSVKSITIRGARGLVHGWIKSDQDWAPELNRMCSLLELSTGEAKLVAHIFDCQGFRE